MRTIENSKVGLAEKMDYLIFTGEKYSPCQQTRMPSSTKSDNGDRFNAEEVVKLSGSSQLYDRLISYNVYKDEFIRISHKTIDLCDSGYSLPDSEEDETSLDSGIRTRSEETVDPDAERQNEGDLEDAERRMLKMPNDDDDLLASQDSKNEVDLSGDSCEMTYIELDLSSQSHEDVSDDVELMMKNLKIGPSQAFVHSDSYNFDSSDTTPVKVCVDDESDEKNDKDSKLDEISEKQVLNLHNDVKDDSAMNFIHSSGHKFTSSNSKQEARPEFFGSFLPITESSLGSLPEKTYIQIVERLLDEQTLLKLNAEENHLFNSDSCRTTLNTHDIPFVPSEMESSNGNLKSSFTLDETDPASKMCPMTYVDLDINEPYPENLTLRMLNNLSIKDDKSSLCRGNPSDPDSEATSGDLDGRPFSADRARSEMDVHNDSSLPAFYPSQTFPFGAEFNLGSTVCLPPFANDCITKTYKTCPEVNTVEERSPLEINSPRSSILPPVASTIPFVNNSLDQSFFDGTSENGETHYEHEYVTKNLHRLQEIEEILGVLETNDQQTVLPPSPPSGNTVPPFFSRQTCPTNLLPMKNPIPTTPLSLDSNVIPRVTTQTPSTQSDAIPASPGILVVLSTTSLIHGLKRPTRIETSEPAKKPFGFDNFNNSSLSKDSRKMAKDEVASLTDEQLLEFKNSESCLHEAVRTTNHECVVALLKRLKNLDSHKLDILNAKNDKSQTPLHLAVQANIPAIVYLLIKYGAEVNHLAMTPSNELEAPLHYVASQGNQFKLVLKCLLKAKDLDIDIKNSHGQTALHCAAVAHGTAGSNPAHSINSEYIIKKLLTSGADPLIQDNNGKNVLMYAIESKDLNLVSHIMKTVCKDQIQELLAATTSNGQMCLNLTYSLKEQFTQIQWEKLVNILTRHTSSN